MSEIDEDMADIDERPEVMLSSARLGDAVRSGLRFLGSDPELYSRDGRITRVVEDDGRSRIVPVSLAQLRVRLTDLAHWMRYDERTKEWFPTQCPDAVVRGVHEWNEWPDLRPLLGVLDTPALRPDGSVIEVPGYDRDTRFLYRPRNIFPRIPEQPSKDEANSALAELAGIFVNDPIRGFPFRSLADQYVPIAMLMTLLARPAILGAVPGFVFDAATRGSGKSLQANVVALIATGQTGAVLAWPDAPEEQEKVLAGCALEGARLVCFDNARSGSAWGGAILDRILTAEDLVKLRVLGTNGVPECRWRATTCISGNNLVLAGDTARRVLMGRLESSLERPEERDPTAFEHPDLLGYVRRHRGELVRAALTALRAFVLAGCPDQKLRPWGGYIAWQRLVPSAIVWAGGADPCLCRPTVLGEEDADGRALRALLDALGRLEETKGEGLTAGRLAALLWPSGWRDGPPDPARDALEEVAPSARGGVPDGRSLGYLLRRVKGRVVDGKRIACDTAHDKVQRWKVQASK